MSQVTYHLILNVAKSRCIEVCKDITFIELCSIFFHSSDKVEENRRNTKLTEKKIVQKLFSL